MKTILSTLVGIMLFSASSYASKARLEALGQDHDGSLYIMDNRNIFLNPASLNDIKDGIYTEWGTAGTTDTASAPNAEGGFIKSMGNMKFGLHMGAQSTTERSFKDAFELNTGRSFLHQDNNVDLFIAGEAGVKWGANLSYSASELEVGGNKAKESSMGIRLGASQNAWSAFAHVGLSGKSEGSIDAANGNAITTGDEYKGKSSMTLGATYKMGNDSVFVKYSNKASEILAGTPAIDLKASSTSLGWHHGHDVGENSMWFYTFSYDQVKTEIATVEAEDSALNALVGFEAKGNSWLTLSGSATQRVFINTVKDSGSKPNTTVVAAGASLNFGNLSIDGSFSQAAAGKIGTNDLLSRASMTYSF